MGKWMELAARLEAEGVGDNKDVRDNSPNQAPNVPYVPNVPGSLPLSITSGLRRLLSMAAPRLACPAVWPRVVSDALSLASQGWAEKAFALGWTPLDLFGAVTEAAGDPFSDGLAVWLAGRSLVVICDQFAAAEDNVFRAYFQRHQRDGAKLLWEIE